MIQITSLQVETLGEKQIEPNNSNTKNLDKESR